MRRLILICGLVLLSPALCLANQVTVIQPFGAYHLGDIITDGPTISAILANPQTSGFVVETVGGQQSNSVPAPQVTGTYNGVPTNLALGAGVSTDGSTLSVDPSAALAAKNAACTSLTAAGTNAGSATPLTCSTNVLVSVPPGTGAIVDATKCQGLGQTIINSGANQAKVYTPAGSQMFANGAGMGVGNPGLLAGGVKSTVYCPSSTVFVAY